MKDILDCLAIIGRRIGALAAIAAPFAALLTLIAQWPNLDPAGFDAVMTGWGRRISWLLVPGLPFYVMVLLPWWLAMLTVAAGFAVAWHRRLLDDGGPFARGYAMAVLVYAAILLGLALLAMLIGGGALALAERMAEAGGRPAGVITLVAAAGLAILAAGRLLPELAAAAIGEPRMSFGASLRATRGRTLRIGLCLLVLIFPVFAALMVSFVMAGPSGGSVAATAIKSLIWLAGTTLVATYASLLYARATGETIAPP